MGRDICSAGPRLRRKFPPCSGAGVPTRNGSSRRAVPATAPPPERRSSCSSGIMRGVGEGACDLVAIPLQRGWDRAGLPLYHAVDLRVCRPHVPRPDARAIGGTVLRPPPVVEAIFQPFGAGVY